MELTPDSIAILKTHWQAADYRQFFLTLLDRLPNICFPWGEQAYDCLANQWGVNTPYAPHNLWRELFHLTGGFVVGLALFWIHPWVPIALLFGGMGYKLFFVDSKEGKPFSKSFFDLASWVGGSAIPLVWWKG